MTSEEVKERELTRKRLLARANALYAEAVCDFDDARSALYCRSRAPLPPLDSYRILTIALSGQAREQRPGSERLSLRAHLAYSIRAC